MSDSLADLRQGLADLLSAAGIPAVASVPEVIDPPLAFVAPDDPYVDFDGGTFGEAIAHHQVVLVVAAGDNDVQIGDLDEMVLAVLGAYQSGQLGDHVVVDVQQPGQLSINGQAHLAVGISTVVPFSLR